VFRYVALIWNPTDSARTATAETVARTLKQGSTQWRTVCAGGGVQVLCADVNHSCLRAHVLSHGRGVIVGALFRTQPDAPETTSDCKTLAESECDAIARSDGRRLIEDYWGNYVAFLRNCDSNYTTVLKDPTGELPCLHTTHHGVHIFFSCLSDCLGLGLVRFSINWDYVRLRIGGGAFDLSENALREVRQIHRGEAVRVDQNLDLTALPRQFYWNPSTFTTRSRALTDAEEAARLLRATLRGCTRAQTENHPNLLVRLSGGLDSSIILSCLSGTTGNSNITAYTYFNPRGKSGERRWARLAAHAAGCRHLERAFDPSEVNLEPMLDVMPSVEPTFSMGYVVRGPAERLLSATYGCSAVISGDGGDAVLGSECIGLSVDDYLRLHGPGLGMIRIAEQVASFRDLSIGHVLARALRRWWRGSMMTDYATTLYGARKLVSPNLPNTLLQKQRYPHPWFENDENVPWETIHRLGVLAIHPRFYDPLLTPQQPDMEQIAPMFAQPFVELCLRIPIYLHFIDGRERGLARRAFESDVPQPILARQWKDRAPESLQRFKRRNLALLRSVLLNGLLVQQQLANKPAIEQALREDSLSNDVNVAELLNLLDMEIWLSKLSRSAVEPSCDA
jgi:asparagine synthase (glutamine-hydrolysing)